VIPGSYRENNTSTLRAAMRQPADVSADGEPLWQMDKFSSNARPALDTFRSESARQRSTKQPDCVNEA